MGIIYKNSVAYGIGDDSVEITQADYDALSDAEKHNGKTYFITDADIPSGGDNSIELTLIEYKELERSGQIKQDVTYYVKDEESSITSVVLTTDKTKAIRFGIDEEGNWGYIPDGADTVIPFKRGEENSWVDLGYYGATDGATIDLNQFEDGILQYICPFQTTSFFYVLIYVQNHHPIYMSRIIYDANRILYQWYSGDIGAILWSVVDGVLQIAASPDMVGNKYYRFTALPYSIPPI